MNPTLRDEDIQVTYLVSTDPAPASGRNLPRTAYHESGDKDVDGDGGSGGDSGDPGD